MRLSHLNGWRAVEAVYRTGSIAAAATDLSVTRAAVAAQVRALETALDRQLFERANSGLRPEVHLVEQGEKLRAAFGSLAEVQASLTHEIQSNRVALSVSPTFAETWLPRHMSDLFSRQPEIDLRLQSTWEVTDLRGSETDFAIRYMAPGRDDPVLKSVSLMGSGVVPVCTPDFARRYDLDARDLSLDGVPLVHIDVPTTDPDWVGWSGWRDRMGLPPQDADKVAPRYELAATSVRLALGGFGLVLGGLSDVFAALEDGSLVMPFGPASVQRGSYAHHLVWRRDAPMGKVQRAFRDWVIARAEDDRRIMARLFEF